MHEAVAAAPQFGNWLTAANAVALSDADVGDVGIDSKQVARVADHDNGHALGTLCDRGDGASVSRLD